MMFDPTKILMALIASSALLLALRANVGNRSIFRSNLSWGMLPTHVSFEGMPPRLLAMDPIATFTAPTSDGDAQAIVILWVRNDSRRKISDIKLELVYPQAFYLDEDIVERQNVEVLEHFPDMSVDVKAIRKNMKRREAVIHGDLVHVSYEVGILRPGEGRAHVEFMKAPEPERAFADSRLETTMFGDILQKLAESAHFAGVSHVRATVLSDLNRPAHKWVNAVALRQGIDPTGTAFQTAYVDSHWLGRIPAGETFRKPIWPWKQHTLIEELPVLTIIPELKIVTKRLEDKVAVLSRIDEIATQYGLGSIFMPGYSYFRLPSGTDVEAAIASMGYKRSRRSPARAAT